MTHRSDAAGHVLFHEVFGRYFGTVARLIACSLKRPLRPEDILKIAGEAGFAETAGTVLRAVEDGSWPLFERTNAGYVAKVGDVSRPLTEIERSWLAAILEEPRAGLFLDDGTRASLLATLDAEPLYRHGDFLVVDAHNDPDPFTDAGYRRSFGAALKALKSGRALKVRFRSRLGRYLNRTVRPACLQYSLKDDKFRLLSSAPGHGGYTVNLGRVQSARVLPDAGACGAKTEAAGEMRTATVELMEERGALERALIHFASFECEAFAREKGIVLEIRYPVADETELLVRLLAFGPLIRVCAPEALVAQICERVRRQRGLLSQAGLLPN